MKRLLEPCVLPCPDVSDLDICRLSSMANCQLRTASWEHGGLEEKPIQSRVLAQALHFPELQLLLLRVVLDPPFLEKLRPCPSCQLAQIDAAVRDSRTGTVKEMSWCPWGHCPTTSAHRPPVLQGFLPLFARLPAVHSVPRSINHSQTQKLHHATTRFEECPQVVEPLLSHLRRIGTSFVGQSQLDHRVCIQHTPGMPNLKCMGTAVVVVAATNLALEVRFVSACRKGPLTLDSLATSLQSLEVLGTQLLDIVWPSRVVSFEHIYQELPPNCNLKTPTTGCPLCIFIRSFL